MKLIRIVADTNILISSIFWRGNPYKILIKCLKGEIKLIVSKEILEEVERILLREKKFKLTKMDVSLHIQILLSISELVKPYEKIKIVKKDSTDNIFLECAVEGKAEYIVSGDTHLLELKEFRGIRIVTAKEMVVILESKKKAG